MTTSVPTRISFSAASMVAPANPEFDRKSLREKQSEYLERLLSGLTDVGILVEERRHLVSRFLNRRRDISFTDHHPDMSLEVLKLPTNIEAVLGRQGLGVRTIDQLTRYSRPFLEKQCALYEDRTIGKIAPKVPNVTEMMDIIEHKLGMMNLSLASELTHDV